MDSILMTKAKQAQLCFEDLKKRTGIESDTKVIFHVDEDQKQLMKSACFHDNPFPGVLKVVLLSLRLKAVKRLFEEEHVLQTGSAAAVLALDAVQAQEIKNLRDGISSENADPVICDVGFAGLHQTVSRARGRCITGTQRRFFTSGAGDAGA